jgi:hypothetical protein
MPRASESSGRSFILVGMIVFFVVPYGIWYLYDQYIKTDEDRIRDQLAGAVQGAKDRIPRKITGILSDDFRGPQGISADDAHRFLIHILVQKYREVDAALLPDPVPVALDENDKTKAVARFKVRMRGRVTEDAAWEPIVRRYSDESNVELVATFKKTKDGWLITRVASEAAP